MLTINDVLIKNLEETRRRSLILWNGLPESHYFWKPDEAAMHALEMIRHVVGANHYLHYVIQHKGDTSRFPAAEWDALPYHDVDTELKYGQPYWDALLHDVRNYTASELAEMDVVYGKRKPRKLGDFVLRIAYHEAVHAGNFIAYLRAMGIERPWVWD
jgi:uncharacterized damage-inducible protein DinB